MIKPTEAELLRLLKLHPPLALVSVGAPGANPPQEQPSEGSVTALVSLEPGVCAGTEIQLRAGKAKGQEKRALGVSWEASLVLWQ